MPPPPAGMKIKASPCPPPTPATTHPPPTHHTQPNHTSYPPPTPPHTPHTSKVWGGRLHAIYGGPTCRWPVAPPTGSRVRTHLESQLAQILLSTRACIELHVGGLRGLHKFGGLA